MFPVVPETIRATAQEVNTREPALRVSARVAVKVGLSRSVPAAAVEFGGPTRRVSRASSPAGSSAAQDELGGVHSASGRHLTLWGSIRFATELRRLPTCRRIVDSPGFGKGADAVRAVSDYQSRHVDKSIEHLELQKADVWPLHPEGEIMLGVKLEDQEALDRAAETLSVPGLAFAEDGPRVG